MKVLDITSEELDGILGIDRSDPSEKPMKKPAKTGKKKDSGDTNEVDLEVEGEGENTSESTETKSTEKKDKPTKTKKVKVMKRKDMTNQQKKMLDPSYAGAVEDDEMEFLISQLNASSALRKKWGIVGNVTAKKIQKPVSVSKQGY